MTLRVWISLIAIAAPALAEPCHDHPAPAAQTGFAGPVILSEAQRHNLGIQTVEAAIEELAPAVEVPALLVLPPERHARITAPFEGRVTELLVKLGDRVRKGQPLLRVTPFAVGSPSQELSAPLEGVVFEQAAVVGTAFTLGTVLMQTGDYSELLARGVFYQSPQLAEIASGQRTTIRLDIFPGEIFTGRVQRVDPGHEEASPAFHIYALVPNSEGKLKPNFRARMSIEIAKPQPGIAIPQRAILGTMGKLFVFVETEPGCFERREITTGLKSGDRVEIIEGVLPGDRVVTVGNYQLQHVLPNGAAAVSDGHGHDHPH